MQYEPSQHSMPPRFLQGHGVLYARTAPAACMHNNVAGGDRGPNALGPTPHGRMFQQGPLSGPCSNLCDAESPLMTAKFSGIGSRCGPKVHPRPKGCGVSHCAPSWPAPALRGPDHEASAGAGGTIGAGVPDLAACCWQLWRLGAPVRDRCGSAARLATRPRALGGG